MRREIRTSVRYRVLKRDGFKCSYCGVSASESPLEIDHIQPVSRGGTNHLSNLRSACHECNAGKGAEEPEWFPCDDCLDANGLPNNLPFGLERILEDKWVEPLDGMQYQFAWSQFYDDFHSQHGRFPSRVIPGDHDGWDPIKARIDAVIGPDGVGNARCRS